LRKKFVRRVDNLIIGVGNKLFIAHGSILGQIELFSAAKKFGND